jgi:hypothetical protein
MIGVILIVLSFLSPHVIAANKTVALLPALLIQEAYLGQGIKTMLASRLSGEGLEVITPDSVLSGADRQGVTSEQRAEEIARLLKANYAVFGSVTSLGTGCSLDLSFMDLTKDKPEVTKVSESVTEDQLIPKLSEIVYDFRAIAAGVDVRKQKSVDPGGKKTQRACFQEDCGIKRVQADGRAPSKQVYVPRRGRPDGDGQPEILALSREALMIYSRKEKGLVLKETLRGDRSEEFLKVSAADIDGNGRPEIYLVSFYGKRAQTSVWEWSDKFTKKLDRQNGHFHVLRNQGGGQSTLIFMDSGIDKFFMGKMWKMGYDQAANWCAGSSS